MRLGESPLGRRVFKVWLRDLIVWSKYWHGSLVGSLGEPVLYFLGIGYGLGSFIPAIEGIPYIQYLAPALIASSVMNSASFETTFSSFTRMEIQKTYQSIAATPVSMEEVIAGEILWAATKACLTGTVMFIAVAFLGFIHSPWAFAAIPVVMMTALLFASIGMTVTSYAPDYDFFTYYFTLFLEPMFLFSGTFFPLSSMPPLLQTFAWFLPLTPSVYVVRSLFQGHVGFHLLGPLLGTIVLTLFFFFFAIRRMVKRLVV
ncbi:MAG: ABC transporter permease [Deltaproteobacteria bacterium]|nr:ABC transporter permease [Deltaproteobacteria bacterium]